MTDGAFTVVVPCYNEEGAIVETIATLQSVLRTTGPYDLIVVDDGSTDRTAQLLRDVMEREPSIKVVFHERNRGYGAAIKTGIRRASTDLIVITDADGTYPNERIPDLLRSAKHADMVVGARTGEKVKYSLIRKIPKMFLSRYMSWLAGQSIPDMNSGLRVFRRAVVERFLNILPNGFSFTATITLAMLTNYYGVRFVPINYARRIGRSKIRPVRDTLQVIQLIVRTGMYFAPLRVFLPLVGILALSFVGSLLYDIIVLRNITDKTLILLMFSMNTAMFALLADMLDKRTSGG